MNQIFFLVNSAIESSLLSGNFIKNEKKNVGKILNNELIFF